MLMLMHRMTIMGDEGQQRRDCTSDAKVDVTETRRRAMIYAHTWGKRKPRKRTQRPCTPPESPPESPRKLEMLHQARGIYLLRKPVCASRKTAGPPRLGSTLVPMTWPRDAGTCIKAFHRCGNAQRNHTFGLRCRCTALTVPSDMSSGASNAEGSRTEVHQIQQWKRQWQ